MSTHPTDLDFSDDGVLDTPETAFASFDADAQLVGGEYAPPTDEEGCLGRTMFDTPTSQDGTVTVLLPAEQIRRLPGQALVRIVSRDDDRQSRTYLGAVVAGPFAEPDGLRADATALVVTTVRGGYLMPRHHGRAQVEIVGERLASGLVVPSRRRPRPNSPVFALDAAESAAVLKLAGDLRLGLADGFDDLPVLVPGRSKGVFPRHLGILGTTGGGKSTTVAGLIAKAQRLGIAVVLIDTEGEYSAIQEPADNPEMLAALDRAGIEPAGVDDVHLFHLVGRETANPEHPRRAAFSLRFSALSPYAVQEILELNDPQQERFFKAYDVTKRAMERFGIFPRNNPQWRDKDQQRVLTLDEQETGYPSMTLAQLYDVVREIEAAVDKRDDEPALDTAAFAENRSQLRQFINTDGFPKNVPSWRALMGRLGRLKRLRIFDSRQARPLPFGEMLRPGRVNVVDLSDTDSPAVRNLVIAELLRGVQQQQERLYREAVARDEQPTPVLVVIEEAHEFLSTQRIAKMPVLFQQVAKIARRGRKRYLGLCFVTQLPQHLPDEVLGLINNWIFHKIADAGVIARLKKSTGGIGDALWQTLPSLAPGQAVVSFTTMSRPLQTTIDPAPCQILMTD